MRKVISFNRPCGVARLDPQFFYVALQDLTPNFSIKINAVVADHFSLPHQGSVSSTIRAVAIDLQDGSSKKRIAQIENGLNVIKLI